MDHVLWEDLGEHDRVGDHLRGPQTTFLNAALDRVHEADGQRRIPGGVSRRAPAGTQVAVTDRASTG